jgi:hypothetical protein
MIADQNWIGLSAGMEAERYRWKSDQNEAKARRRENILSESLVGKKKPLRPRGQEGCVWLEKVTELIVAAASGPAAQSWSAEKQAVFPEPTELRAAWPEWR